MLDADGWCLLTVLYMVLSEIGIWHGDSKSAGKDALLLHTFTGTSLACYKLVYFYLFLVAVHVIFPFVVCIWERAENLKQEDDKGAEGLHPEKQTEKECH